MFLMGAGMARMRRNVPSERLSRTIPAGDNGDKFSVSARRGHWHCRTGAQPTAEQALTRRDRAQ